MPLVVVAAAFHLAWTHWEQRLRPVELLDLRFLIYATPCPVRWVHVESHDIPDLVDEQGILGELECLTPVRFQTESSPDAADRAAAETSCSARDRVLQ